GGETPGPIPNPEVKPSSADGTALETGWESRSPPRLLRMEPPSGGSLRFGTLPPMAGPRRPRTAPPTRAASDLPRGVLGALGQTDRAVENAAQVFDADVPEEVKAEAAIVGASAFADMGQFEEGLGFLRRFATRSDVGRPFDLRVWYVSGDLLEHMGRREDAAREFLKILRYDREAFDAAERLAALS